MKIEGNGAEAFAVALIGGEVVKAEEMGPYLDVANGNPFLAAALASHAVAGDLKRCEAIRRAASPGTAAVDVARHYREHGASLLRLVETWQ